MIMCVSRVLQCPLALEGGLDVVEGFEAPVYKGHFSSGPNCQSDMDRKFVRNQYRVATAQHQTLVQHFGVPALRKSCQLEKSPLMPHILLF